MAYTERQQARAKAWAGEIDAARRRAGLVLPDGLASHTAWLGRLISEWALAEVAPGRLMPWLAVAYGFGIVVYFTADREPAWWAVAASSVTLSGFVEIREERERSDRITLRVHRMNSARRLADVPDRVRLAVRKNTAPAVGSFIELKARLSPPLAPLRPGGHDFARDMYFQRIGASGYALGKMQIVQPQSAATPGCIMRP